MEGLGVVGDDGVASEPVHALLGAEDRPPQRMLGPEGGDEDLVNEVVRRVFDHTDLFEDDASLHLQVVVREARCHDDLGEEVEGEGELLVEHVGVERGVLLAGEGIDVAAEHVDDFGDVGGRPIRRSLEDEVLEEVRRAAVLLAFHGRSGAEVIAEGHRTDVRKRLDEDGQS